MECLPRSARAHVTSKHFYQYSRRTYEDDASDLFSVHPSIYNDLMMSEDDRFWNGFPVKRNSQVLIYQTAFWLNKKKLCSNDMYKDHWDSVCIRCDSGFASRLRSTCMTHIIAEGYRTCENCEQFENTPGCTMSGRHISSGLKTGVNIMNGFVDTQSAKSYSRLKIAGIDCEMAQTRLGLELCKVTLVDERLQVVYESYVRPIEKIIDFKTSISGVNHSHMKRAVSFERAQRDILNLIGRNTILVGHALNNDLRALRLVHDKVVDTSILYPHNNGFPFKLGLKTLAQNILHMDIQNGESHSSYEDAATATQLALLHFHRVRRNFQQSYSL